ncbi:MAG: helix-turn-helix transcriptional regulator [Chakrabartia sp.]
MRGKIGRRKGERGPHVRIDDGQSLDVQLGVCLQIPCRGDAAERLRDGIYVLRFDEALLVKRLALNPATRRISIRSDNPAYPAWEDCDPASIALIGRVIWAARRFS